MTLVYIICLLALRASLGVLPVQGRQAFTPVYLEKRSKPNRAGEMSHRATYGTANINSLCGRDLD